MPNDRQVIVRAGDTIRYVAFPAWVQLSLGACVVAFIGASALTTTAWFGGATEEMQVRRQLQTARSTRDELHVGLTHAREEVALLAAAPTSKEGEIAHYELDTATLREEIATMRVRVAGLQEPVERAAPTAKDLYDDGHDASEAGAEPSEELQRLTADVARLEQERARLAEDRNHYVALVRQMESQLPALVPGQGDVRQRLSEARSELDKVREQRADVEQRYARLQRDLELTSAELDEARRTHELTRRDLAEIDVLLKDVSRDRAVIVAERDQLADRVDTLERRFAILADDQSAMLARLGEQTADTLSAVERTVAMTGLDVDRLLDRLDFAVQPQGGPYIAAEFLNEPVDELAGRIAGLERQVDRLEQMQKILAILPLASPMDNSWITSGFGRRRDPMTEKWAVHNGLDLAARPRSPIYATSAGRVTFVGWRGGYGKVVEIDHGLGVRTRYGHLSRIFVKRDQLVDFREQVGLLGNTGRSTGEHLHYEVLVDNGAYDPANFMRAGKYVFK